MSSPKPIKPSIRVPEHLELDLFPLQTIPQIQRTAEDLFLLDQARQDPRQDPLGRRLELSELSDYQKPFLFLAAARSYLKSRMEDVRLGIENPLTSRDFRDRIEQLGMKKEKVVPIVPVNEDITPLEKTPETPSIAPLNISSIWYIKSDATSKKAIQLSSQAWIQLESRFLTPTSYGLLRGPGAYIGIGALTARLEVDRKDQKREIEIANMTPLEFGIEYSFALPFRPVSFLELLPSFSLGLGALVYRPNYSEAALVEGYRKACDPITGELIRIDDIRRIRERRMPQIEINPDAERVALCQAQEAFNFYFQAKGEISLELSIRFFELLTLGTGIFIDYRQGDAEDLVRDIVPEGWNLRWKALQLGVTY